MALSSPALPRTLCTFKSRRAAAVSRRLYLYATAGSRHYRHRFARLPPSSFEFPNESSPSPHPCSLPLNGATTCYLSIVTCRRSTRVDAKHLPARKLVSTARGGGGGGGERIEGTARAQIPTTCITSAEHLFAGVLYYISIRFFLFLLLPLLFHFLFLFSSFLPLSPHRHHRCHFRALPCLLYTHLRAYQTYANACKLEYAHWRNGAINKNTSTTTFLERSPGSFNPPSDSISTLPPITFPAPPTIDDNNNNSNNIIPTLARTLAESLGLAWKCRVRKIGRKTNCDFAGCV